MAKQLFELFRLPPERKASSNHTSISKESSQGRRRRISIRKTVFRLFHIRHGNQSTTKPALPTHEPAGKMKKTKRRVMIVFSPFRFRKNKPHPSIKTLEILDIKNPQPSIRDSKFSVVSSTQSFHSLPSELVNLSTLQRDILLHLARKAWKSLYKQEAVTRNFTANLKHLLSRMGRIIRASRRLHDDYKENLIIAIAGLQELVRRTVLEKEAIRLRSVRLVQELGMNLAQAVEDVEKKRTLVKGKGGAGDSDLTLASSLSLEHSTQYLIDMGIFTSLATLKVDLVVQEQLDWTLRGGIVGRCEDLWFPTTHTEKIAMKRFVGFVDDCLARLGKSYTMSKAMVENLESLVEALRESWSHA